MFNVGVLMKGVNGILEIAGGALVLTIKTSTLIGIILILTQQELIEDPHDVVATMLRHTVNSITESSKTFGGVYLIAHGASNVFLAVGLLQRRLWSYPASIVFLCIFIGYQLYRITLHHSIVLMVVTGLDIIIVFLIWKEYIAVKSKIA